MAASDSKTNGSDDNGKKDGGKQSDSSGKAKSDKSSSDAGKAAADGKTNSVAAMAAYEVMINRASKIVGGIIKSGKLVDTPQILIVDSLDVLSSEIPYIQALEQVKFWEKTLKNDLEEIELLKPPESTWVCAMPDATGGAVDIITKVADIIGRFNFDYDIQEREISLPNVALQALVAGRFAELNYSVYLPAFHRLSLDSKLVARLGKLIDTKDALKLKVEELKGRIAANKPSNGGEGAVVQGQEKTEEQTKNDKIQKACKAVKDRISQFDAFYKNVVSVPDGGGYSPLACALIGEYLEDNKITHLLYLSVIGLGGETIIGKAQLREGTATFLGGCGISYILAESGGRIVSAGTEYGSAFAKVKLGHIKSLKFHEEINVQAYGGLASVILDALKILLFGLTRTSDESQWAKTRCPFRKLKRSS